MIEIRHGDNLYTYEGEVIFSVQTWYSYDSDRESVETKSELTIRLVNDTDGYSPLPEDGDVLNPIWGALEIRVNGNLIYEAAECARYYGFVTVDGDRFPYRPPHAPSPPWKELRKPNSNNPLEAIAKEAVEKEPLDDFLDNVPDEWKVIMAQMVLHVMRGKKPTTPDDARD